MRDVVKVWFYAAVVLLTGAWVAPIVYNGGKALAEICATKTTNGIVDTVAKACEMMQFPDFYKLAVALMAAFWFMPFVELLRLGNPKQTRHPGSIRLPESALELSAGQRLRKNWKGGVHAALGFSLMTGFFILLGYGLLRAGSFNWVATGNHVWRLTLAMLAISGVLALVKELLFRGIVLGIFLRAMRPTTAMFLSALLFACVHFLLPVAGVNVLDPDARNVGFEMLGKLVVRITDWQALLADFSVLFTIGWILSYARWKTASLWLPVGLQTGWIFAEWIFGRFTVMVERPDSLARLLSGESIHQGLIPLVGLLMIGWAIYFITGRNHEPVAAEV